MKNREVWYLGGLNIDLMRGLVKAFIKGWVRGLVRVLGKNPNKLQECFNLSQLPSPDEGIVCK